MGNVIEEKGPLGVTLRCSAETWSQHILYGHPIMERQEHLVAEVVRAPDAIFESNDSMPDDTRWMYVKEGYAEHFQGALPWVKVVASVAGNGGDIITAYPAKHERGGHKEEALYRANNKTDV